MKRIAIIGGGISGLSAAFFLERQRRAGRPLEYRLFESSGRFGGVIRSERLEGCLIEGGPDSFLTEKPWAADLCRELAIGGELTGSNDADRGTYILLNGKLVAIPDGLAFIVPTKILPMISSPLFSTGTKLRMAREWFHKQTEINEDESVAAFVERHYGSQMVDRLVDPLLYGVYGGDSRQLSLRALLPRFAKMQAKHGSLGRAMIHNRKTLRKGGEQKERPLFTTLTNGMQGLTNAILRALPPTCLRESADVRSVSRENVAWSVSSRSIKESFDCLVFATPAYAVAELLNDATLKLSSELRAIQYSPSVTATLGYERKVRQQLPPGFGFLIPHNQGKRMAAVTFVHNKFAGRASEGRALLRCFLGGIRDEGVLALSESEILALVCRELREILGVTAEPLFARVYKWKAAMAQYNVGHLDRVLRIEALRREVPGIFLAGNAYHGIGVPDCVRSGEEAAQAALGFKEQ